MPIIRSSMLTEKTYFCRANYRCMKIFLNDRVIRFTATTPDNLLPTDMAVPLSSTEKLYEAFCDFARYEKYKTLWVLNANFPEFASVFKYIPAAGGLVKNEKGDYLFIHRLGHWDLPKGKIDRKEIQGAQNDDNHDYSARFGEVTQVPFPSAARFAAMREVKEETGLRSVTIVRDLTCSWHMYKLKDKYILKQTWWFEMTASSSQTLKPQTSEGIFLVKWTPPDAIHCIMSHTYASIREMLLEVMF